MQSEPIWFKSIFPFDLTGVHLSHADPYTQTFIHFDAFRMKWWVLACKKNTGFPLHCVLWLISIQESQYISSVTRQGRISIPRSGKCNVGVFKCVRKLHVCKICVCFVQFRSFACKDLSTLKCWEKNVPPSAPAPFFLSHATFFPSLGSMYKMACSTSRHQKPVLMHCPLNTKGLHVETEAWSRTKKQESAETPTSSTQHYDIQICLRISTMVIDNSFIVDATACYFWLKRERCDCFILREEKPNDIQNIPFKECIHNLKQKGWLEKVDITLVNFFLFLP